MKRLTRTNEKVLAGVLGGLSHYVNPELDPIFFRAIFICLAIYNPAVVLVYFGLMLILPAEPVNVSNSRVHT